LEVIIVEVSELIEALEKMRRDINHHSTRLADGIGPDVKGTDEETFLLSVCNELSGFSRKIFGVIESLRDYNSRHNIPIP